MRTTNTTSWHWLCCCLFISIITLFSACTSGKQLTQNPSKQLIIGHWVVESINIGNQVVSARHLGREIRFSFEENGVTSFTGPSGLTEYGKYQVENQKIYDPEHPTESPVDIVSINNRQMVLSMVENGEEMKMTLVPRGMEVSSRE